MFCFLPENFAQCSLSNFLLSLPPHPPNLFLSPLVPFLVPIRLLLHVDLSPLFCVFLDSSPLNAYPLSSYFHPEALFSSYPINIISSQVLDLNSEIGTKSQCEASSRPRLALSAICVCSFSMGAHLMFYSFPSLDYMCTPMFSLLFSFFSLLLAVLSPLPFVYWQDCLHSFILSLTTFHSR